MNGQYLQRPVWNMLDSYQEGQPIFGRDKEIVQLTDSVVENIHTIVYGRSGIGKTSVLQAGVFPKLRDLSFFPVVIRLSLNSGDYVSIVKNCVRKEAFRVDNVMGKDCYGESHLDGFTESSTLLSFFSKVRYLDDKGVIKIPVLIFDQFEEQINNKENLDRTVKFLTEDLYELIEGNAFAEGQCNDFTNYRIVFSMREDYLYCFEDIVCKHSLYELKNNRFRITALTEQNAKQVIFRTFGDGGLEKGEEERIADAIIGRSKSKDRMSLINTAILSLMSSLLFKNAKDGIVRERQLDEMDYYVRYYYDEFREQVGIELSDRLEKQLLTSDGQRKCVLLKELYDTVGMTDEALKVMKDNKVVRTINPDDKENCRVEYIHDIFADIVIKRTKDEARVRFNNSSIMDGRTTRGVLFQKVVKAIFYYGLIVCVEIGVWQMFIKLGLFPRMDMIGLGAVILLLAITYSTYRSLLYFVPYLIRRLHDVGRSGFWLLSPPLALIFIILPSSKRRYVPRYSAIISRSNDNVGLIGRKDYCVSVLYEYALILVSVIVGMLAVHVICRGVRARLRLRFIDLLIVDNLIWTAKLWTCLFAFTLYYFVLCVLLFNSSATKHCLASKGYNLSWLPSIPILNVLLCLFGKVQVHNDMHKYKTVFSSFNKLRYAFSDKIVFSFMILLSIVPIVGYGIVWIYALSFKTVDTNVYNLFRKWLSTLFILYMPFSFLYILMRKINGRVLPEISPHISMKCFMILNALYTLVMVLIVVAVLC